jgi:class 3 adenylate cyclase
MRSLRPCKVARQDPFPSNRAGLSAHPIDNEEFLTGARSGAEGDVVTMTVLFTDIVASTEHQARVGSREWSRLTDHHDAMVRAALSRHRGREVKTTGEAFWPPSTQPAGRLAAPPTSWPGPKTSGWTFGRGCTPARSRYVATTSLVSP